jgi:hypothetical protein
MTKYIVFYVSKNSAEEQMKNVSPEEMKKGMEPWNIWFDKNKDSVIDRGSPLGKVMNVTKEGAVPGQSWIAGYTILQAETMDALKMMLMEHPHLMQPETSLQVLEFLPMQGM